MPHTLARLHVSIAAENLVGALARKEHFDVGLARDVLAEQEMCNTAAHKQRIEGLERIDDFCNNQATHTMKSFLDIVGRRRVVYLLTWNCGQTLVRRYREQMVRQFEERGDAARIFEVRRV